MSASEENNPLQSADSALSGAASPPALEDERLDPTIQLRGRSLWQLVSTDNEGQRWINICPNVLAAVRQSPPVHHEKDEKDLSAGLAAGENDTTVVLAHQLTHVAREYQALLTRLWIIAGGFDWQQCNQIRDEIHLFNYDRKQVGSVSVSAGEASGGTAQGSGKIAERSDADNT